jgi:hypothetical protein
MSLNKLIKSIWKYPDGPGWWRHFRFDLYNDVTDSVFMPELTIK